MARARNTSVAAVAGGGDPFHGSASLRQPADALGPRAERTVARVIGAARDVFLARGYRGTTIDEIARVADVSRASFYTYFASKRDVLLAVGAQSSRESDAMIDQLCKVGSTRTELTDWVREYFGFLDAYGSFAFAWTQAAQEDEQIRVAGMKRHLLSCRHMGERLAATAGKSIDEPVLLGLAAGSLLERSWRYSQLYADTIDRDRVIEQTAQLLWAGARQTSPRMAVA